MTAIDFAKISNDIMILDDEDDIVYIFKKALEDSGFGVFAFTSPELALEHLQTNCARYGLIISDVRMPKMSGIEFAKKVRTFAPSICIVLMSAFSMADLEIQPELKIAELLQKPVTPAKLNETVSKYVKLTNRD